MGSSKQDPRLEFYRELAGNQLFAPLWRSGENVHQGEGVGLGERLPYNVRFA